MRKCQNKHIIRPSFLLFWWNPLLNQSQSRKKEANTKSETKTTPISSSLRLTSSCQSRKLFPPWNRVTRPAACQVAPHVSSPWWTTARPEFSPVGSCYCHVGSLGKSVNTRDPSHLSWAGGILCLLRAS